MGVGKNAAGGPRSGSFVSVWWAPSKDSVSSSPSSVLVGSSYGIVSSHVSALGIGLISRPGDILRSSCGAWQFQVSSRYSPSRRRVRRPNPANIRFVSLEDSTRADGRRSSVSREAGTALGLVRDTCRDSSRSRRHHTISKPITSLSVWGHECRPFVAWPAHLFEHGMEHLRLIAQPSWGLWKILGFVVVGHFCFVAATRRENQSLMTFNLVSQSIVGQEFVVEGGSLG